MASTGQVPEGPDPPGVGQLGGDGAGGPELAAVEDAWLAAGRAGWPGGALEFAPTDPAVQEAAQEVGAGGVARLGVSRSHAETSGDGGGRVGVDERLVGGGAFDPLIRGLPAHPGDVAGGDVVDVEELFMASLLGPHPPAGVGGVGEDGPNCGVGPPTWVPVPVARRVVSGGGGDGVVGELLGDGAEPDAVGVGQRCVPRPGR